MRALILSSVMLAISCFSGAGDLTLTVDALSEKYYYGEMILIGIFVRNNTDISVEFDIIATACGQGNAYYAALADYLASLWKAESRVGDTVQIIPRSLARIDSVSALGIVC
jgi:hypothetical protein